MKNTRVFLLLAAVALTTQGLPAGAAGHKAAAAKSTEAPSVLPFLHDDYPGALAKARARGVPLFVDASAPWCHSCRWLDAFVFTDPAMKPMADKFVWVHINGELAKHADLIKNKLKLTAYPTLYVIDPKDEHVAMRWVGAAPTQRMLGILDEALVVVKNGGSVDNGGSAAEAALAKADKFYSDGKNAEAAAAYGEALAGTTPEWKSYARVVDSRMFALQMTDSNAAVLKLADAAWPHLRHTASSANVAASGLSAALALEAAAPGRAETIARWEAASREVLVDTVNVTNADDRSAVFGSIVDARNDAKDSTAARALCQEWVDYLANQAARAATAEQRTALDPDRLAAILTLGKPELAIPMLEQSEKDFPEDYNPPARLANIYKEMKQWDKALAESDKAMKLAYGPRKVNFYRIRADIQLGLGDTGGARATLQQAIEHIQSLPPEQQSKSAIESFKKRLDTMAAK